MWNLRRILVPLDLGGASVLALERAFDLAAQFRASLTILLVFQMGIDLRSRGFLTYAEAADALSDSDRQVLGTLIQSRMTPDTEVRIGLRTGVVAEEILAAALELEVDLVVMGTHGRRGVSHALLGSVAERVIRSAHVPVLVAHSDHDHELDARTREQTDIRAAR